ncbi:MAG: hypothetical protein IKR74_02825 [Bacilli bacterium]|nr:hypothetical protein [Bacilli bacterium]
MKKKKAIYIASIIFVICLASIFAIAFAYIGKPTETGNANINVSIVSDDGIDFQYTGTATLNLTAALSNLALANASNSYTSYSVSELTNRTVSMTSNATMYPGGLTCSYDIVYTPTVAYTQTPAATSAGLNELVLRGKIGSTVYFETNVAGSSPVVLYTHSISTTSAASTTNQEWGFSARFYNLNIDQSQASGQNPTGVISIENVKCTDRSLSAFITTKAPRSGTDAVSNSPWILTSDHDGEWRYAGKNPDNYIEFNDELWRIIGIMPNIKYCTGTYGTNTECNSTRIGSFVKIIRNGSLGSFLWDYKQTGVGTSTSAYGSNDWSDSQLMLMLNGSNYLFTGYDVSGNKLHQMYGNGIMQGMVKDLNGNNFYNVSSPGGYLDGNGTTVKIPSSATTSSYTATSGTVPKKIGATALSQIATVKWDLYGTNSYTTAVAGSPAAYYNKERNIGNTGAVYYVSATGREKRAVYWYGKIGLMYPSDYGYATGGGTTYDRDTCLGYQMSGWSSGSYQTDCALNSYLLFQNITSTSPGTSGTNQWTISPYSSTAYSLFYVYSTGSINYASATSTSAVRPVLYLKPDITITGGTGKWNDPYTIS